MLVCLKIHLPPYDLFAVLIALDPRELRVESRKRTHLSGVSAPGHGRLRPDQRTVDAEMLGRQQSRFFRLLHHLAEKAVHHFMLDQPIAIAGVGAVIPCRIVTSG